MDRAVPPRPAGRDAPYPDRQDDAGEESYRGSGKLEGKAAVITGGDSGIGRAVAIAFAREGADVLISYLEEDADAEDTKRYVEEAGRRCVLVRGDVSQADHCRAIIAQAVDAFGKVDVLVSNAARHRRPSDPLTASNEHGDVGERLPAHLGCRTAERHGPEP